MQERMQILNLLEEGKVGVDEAARLLKALGGSCCEPIDECCDTDDGDESDECCEPDGGGKGGEPKTSKKNEDSE